MQAGSGRVQAWREVWIQPALPFPGAGTGAKLLMEHLHLPSPG